MVPVYQAIIHSVMPVSDQTCISGIDPIRHVYSWYVDIVTQSPLYRHRQEDFNAISDWEGHLDGLDRNKTRMTKTI